MDLKREWKGGERREGESRRGVEGGGLSCKWRTSDVDLCHADKWRKVMHCNGTRPVSSVKVKQIRQGHIPLQLACVICRLQSTAAIWWPWTQRCRPWKSQCRIYVIEWHGYVRLDVIGWLDDHVTRQNDRKLELKCRYVIAINSV